MQTVSGSFAVLAYGIGALLGNDDIIILDKLVHASIVDAARLSGAKLRVFAHNDLDALDGILKWADLRGKPQESPSSPASAARAAGPSGPRPRALIATESIFSMDGDQAPLREIVALKEKYGAWLMVDEAHATGLYGKNRRGLADALGVSDQIEIQMGTLGKAAGAAGGYVCGSRALIDFLVNSARSFIFSTAPVPAAAAAAAAGIRFIQSRSCAERCQRLWQRVSGFTAQFPPSNARPPGAIIPVMIGNETKAVEAATRLRGQGLFVPAIRYPTVARGQALLRVTLTAAHTASEITFLARALEELVNHNP